MMIDVECHAKTTEAVVSGLQTHTEKGLSQKEPFLSNFMIIIDILHYK